MSADQTTPDPAAVPDPRLSAVGVGDEFRLEKSLFAADWFLAANPKRGPTAQAGASWGEWVLLAKRILYADGEFRRLPSEIQATLNEVEP